MSWKKHGMLFAGLFLLLTSVIWMILAKASVGGFLILASIGSGLIGYGIDRIRTK